MSTQTKKITEDLKQRKATYSSSRRPTNDEVTIDYLLSEVDRLQKIVVEVNSWAVCAVLTTPEDMAQNLPRIVEITS